MNLKKILHNNMTYYFNIKDHHSITQLLQYKYSKKDSESKE